MVMKRNGSESIGVDKVQEVVVSLRWRGGDGVVVVVTRRQYNFSVDQEIENIINLWICN